MISESTDLLRCKQLIEQKLDWGASETWTSADFENLQQRMLDVTGVSLSASTLRRIWGRVDYQHMPSGTTLNTLAQFAGYTDWRQFVRSQSATTLPTESIEPASAKPVSQAINWRKLGWVAGTVLVVSLLGVLAFEQKTPQIDTIHYQFSSKPLTRSIPNSVVFTYDASASPTDSIYIQQSWDQTRREIVAKDGHTHTSMYYEPGFYRAKLVVGQEIVKEHSLLIPTTGWLATISMQPVPIYLKPAEFLGKDEMRLSVAAIRKKNVPLQPEPPIVKYFNVGNFAPIPLTDFSFSCAIKNEYSEGSAACQHSWIALVTTGMPIAIPISAKGCVSELMMMDGARGVSGKNTDLSGLGVNFTDWVHVTCHSDGSKLVISVNNHVAYSAPLPTSKMEIVGLAYGFRGTGAVKDVTLKTKDKLVFQAF